MTACCGAPRSAPMWSPLKPVVVVSQTGEVREEVPFQLRQYLRHDDLFRYGMTPQFTPASNRSSCSTTSAKTTSATIFVEPRLHLPDRARLFPAIRDRSADHARSAGLAGCPRNRKGSGPRAP